MEAVKKILKNLEKDIRKKVPITDNFSQSCKLCNDTGFIVDSAGARRCTHHRQNRLKTVQIKQDIFLHSLHLGLPLRFKNISIDEWQDELHTTRSGQIMSAKLLSVVESKVEELEKNDIKNVMGIFLYGPPGIGKTYALAALYSEIIRKGIVKAAFLNYPRFLGQSKRLFYDRARRNQLLEILYRVPVLFFDDIGSEQAKENPDYSWAQDELYQIIDFRHDEFMFTSFSTNVNIPELELRFKKTLVSRILGMTTAYTCEGDDIRPHIANKQKKSRRF